MATIVTRAGKGSPLTNTEVDANFTNLNTDKVETSTSITAGTGLTGGGDLSTDRSIALDVSGVTAGTEGSASSVPVLTVDQYGRITAVTDTTISITQSQISDLGNYAVTDADNFFVYQTFSNGIGLNNANISGVGNLLFADPGPNEGLEWTGGNWKVYESPDDLTTNSAGNLQFVSGGVRRVTAYTNGDLEVTGTLLAASKSFLIPHPTKAGLQLQYGSLEGPENGVYVRGKLEDSNVITLPDYWTGLVDPTTITVQLTSIGSDPVWVESVDQYTITTGGNTDCFYTVYGERKDVDKLVVEF